MPSLDQCVCHLSPSRSIKQSSPPPKKKAKSPKNMTGCILPQDLQSSKVFFEHQRGNTSLDPCLSEYHHSCSAQGSWGNSKTLHQSSQRAKQIKLLTVKEGPCYPVSKGSVVYEWGAGALELMNWQWVSQHLHNCLERPLQLGLPPLCLEPSRPRSQCFSAATRWWACWWKLSQTWEARGKNFRSGSCRPESCPAVDTIALSLIFPFSELSHSENQRPWTPVLH